MVSVLVAPDKFKGSLSADDVARALEYGLLEAAPRPGQPARACGRGRRERGRRLRGPVHHGERPRDGTDGGAHHCPRRSARPYRPH